MLGAAVAPISGNAATYHSLAAWNAATPTVDFSVTATIPNVGFDFFGACPFSGGGCVATGGAPTPLASSSNTQDTENFINTYTVPSWNVDLIEAAKRADEWGDDFKAGTITSAIAYAVWVLKADNFIIALLFDQPITSLTFAGLRNGLSHLELGNMLSPVPLPPALLLFGSALFGFGYLARRRRRGASPAV
jgi:hypothetical protein